MKTMAEKRNNIESKDPPDTNYRQSRFYNAKPNEQEGTVADFQMGEKVQGLGDVRGIAVDPFFRGTVYFVDDSGQVSAIIETSNDGSIGIAANVTGGTTVGTTLNGAINDSVTTVTVASTASFVSVNGLYRFLIDSEIIWATGRTATTFTSCVRGAESTSAASHSNGAVVNPAPGVIPLYGDIIIDNAVTGGIYPARTNALDLGWDGARWRNVHTEGMWIWDRLLVASSAGKGVATNLVPLVDNNVDLGNSSYQWKNIFLVNAPTVSSARAGKQNIIDLYRGLQSVLNMRPVAFQRNDKEDVYFGFIADEMEEVAPEIADKKGIRYEEIIPILVNAIHDLNHKISTLEDKKRGIIGTWLHNFVRRLR